MNVRLEELTDKFIRAVEDKGDDRADPQRHQQLKAIANGVQDGGDVVDDQDQNDGIRDQKQDVPAVFFVHGILPSRCRDHRQHISFYV